MYKTVETSLDLKHCKGNKKKKKKWKIHRQKNAQRQIYIYREKQQNIIMEKKGESLN